MEKMHISSDNMEQSDEPPPLLAQEGGDTGTEDCPVNWDARVQANGSWDDWKWQMGNRIRNVVGLLNFFPNCKNAFSLTSVIKKYPLAITPYYASLIQRLDASDPVYAQCVPQVEELHNPACLSEDPLEENEDMPVPGLVHRYPDRALVIATTTCSMYCRHCTRKRVAGTREVSISAPRLRQIVTYLRAHPEIFDVIISGGDPMTMSTDAIEVVLSAIRAVPSVGVIRIGTRTPVVLPQRITEELVAMLRKYHPIWVNTHFNHPNELTAQAAQACGRLVDAGIPVGNQSVLLRGVNDSPPVMERLCRGLVRMRVRPYYLFQCDLVKGVEHFRTPLSRGIEIMEYLRGRMSGIAIPQYVVDAPHGGGKIPILPNYVVSMSPTHTVLRNFEGMLVAYPEPYGGTGYWDNVPSGQSAAGVWELAGGHNSHIEPVSLVRKNRRCAHA